MTDAAPDSAPAWLVLAHILRPQGRKGEVLAELLTDFPERFADQPRVFLAPPGYSGPANSLRTVNTLGFFLPVGRNHGRIVLHFGSVDSIEAADALAGLDVVVPCEERRELQEDASYISDLLGCTVFSLKAEGEKVIGMVDDVHFPTAPDGQRRLEDAAPLLVVLSPLGDEILIPFVKEFLATLDVPGKRIHMRLPDGLVEVNTPAAQP